MKSLVLLLLCAGMTLPGAQAGLEVVAVTPLIADLVRSVGGADVSVSALVPPGSDVHEFSPTPGDLRRVHQADIVFLSGLGLESRFLSKLQNGDRDGPVLVSLGDSMPPLTSPASPAPPTASLSAQVDPHWWQSVANARIAARVIADTLAAADPPKAASYRARAATFDRQLDDLARWVRVTVATLPRDRRILVTSHDAFAYFAREYGFTVRPVSGLNPKDQPSSQSVRDLIASLHADAVPALFLESTENPKVLTEITRETGARIGGTLYASGPEPPTVPTYESMIRHNVKTIVKSLKINDIQND